jgi:5-methylcytosine-specific restriction endonuclease McrA
MKDVFQEVGHLILDISRRLPEVILNTRRKPLIGPTFGAGGFHIASYKGVSLGLDAVHFMVIHQESGLVLSMGDDKAEVIDNARLMLLKLGVARVAALAAQCHAEREAAEALSRASEREDAERHRQEVRARIATKLRVPRRRQRIFDASQGKCHYCGTALTLDGKWHIEHKMPKALMGTDEPTNLVASCVPCNTKKRDRTDIEFKQQIGQ